MEAGSQSVCLAGAHRPPGDGTGKGREREGVVKSHMYVAAQPRPKERVKFQPENALFTAAL